MQVFFKDAALKNIGYCRTSDKKTASFGQVIFYWKDFKANIFAAPLENTYTGRLQSMFGAPSINIQDSFWKELSSRPVSKSSLIFDIFYHVIVLQILE